MKKVLIFVLLLLVSMTMFSQSRMMYSWTFDDLLPADETAKAIPSNLGEANEPAYIFLDGSNGSSDFLCASSGTQLTAFGGTTINDPRTTPVAGNSLVLVNSSANNFHLILKFSMKGLKNAELSFATRGTASGFNNHQWAWSIDGLTFNDFGINTANSSTTFELKNHSLVSIPQINNMDSVYLRLTINGASETSGNNRFDNIQINAENFYDLSVLEFLNPENALCGTPNDEVLVKIKNNSLYNVSDFSVQALVTFPDLTTQLLSLPVNSINLETETVLNLGAISTLNPGMYQIKAYHDFEFDDNHLNDTLMYQFQIAEISPIPFMAELDDLADDWMWIINGFSFVAPNLQNNTSRILSAEVNDSQIQANFHNINTIGNISFHNHLVFDCRILYPDYSTAYEMAEEDSLNIFVSTDCGNSFSLFHSVNSENQNVGNDFRRIALPLNQFSGNKAVFKWVLSTVDSNFVVQIDNIEVRNGDLWDMAVVSKVLPVNLPCGSLTDTVRVIYQNVGDGYVTDIPVAVQISRPYMPLFVTYNDTIRQTLSPGEQIEFTFSQTINTTVAGKYTFMMRVSHPFDTVATLGHNANNVVFDSVRTVSPIPVPYYQGFETISYTNHWNTNAQFDAVEELIYANFSVSQNSAYLQSNKRLGAITAGQFLFFDYAYTLANGTAVQMGLNDSISVWISDDCGENYDLIHVVSASNHVVSNSMTRVQLPLTSYLGSSIVVRFEMNSNTSDSRIEIDEIYIDGLPQVNIPGNYLVNVCEGNSYNINVSGAANLQYEWYESSNPLVILGDEQQLSVNQSGVYVVVATNGVGLSAQDSVQINVVALPIVELDLPLAQKYLCPNASFVFLSGNSPAGGTFSGAGISVNRFYPQNAGVGTHVITYSVTQNGCTNTAVDTIIVYPATAVSFSGLTDLCLNDAEISLTQGTPSGGTYSGAGVNGTVFNPQTAGVNTHLITYSYVDGNNCTFSAVDTIIVKPLPNAFAGNNSAICQGNQTTLVASGGTDYVWSTQQQTNAILVSPTQTTVYTVTVTGMNGCTNTSSVSVTVNEYPVATFVLPEDTVCMQTTAFELSGGSGFPSGGTGTYSGTGVSGLWFNPAIGMGTYPIRYTYSLNGCDSSVTRPITVVNCTSIDEYQELSQITVQPNPTDGIFNIVFSDMKGVISVKIFEVSGRVVYETETNIAMSSTLVLNSSTWTSGIYFIQILNENKSYFEKLVKK